MAYVQCINNQGYEASLTVGAVYKVVHHDSDPESLRIIDNEGEDYLYDAGRFIPIIVKEAPHKSTEAVTVHLDPMLKGILQAEALAAQTSVSTLIREWIGDRLDLPVS